MSAPPEAPVARTKRVLPTRARRGGPGIGSCDVDNMILDTIKRRGENDPLIPGNTRFLLTTDSRTVPPESEAPVQVNREAEKRYFDRPEVIRSLKEQREIEIPDFVELDSSQIIGSRLRTRGNPQEELGGDTSDAAYEKRHRKYENFEKRIRLREKEKLKHEQYKLKERMEQLRAMDGSVFLNVPATSFTAPPGVSAIVDDIGASYLPGAHINGAAAHNEGERRRNEMLAVGTAIEERYRILLPPERRHVERSARVEAPLASTSQPTRVPEPEIEMAIEPVETPPPRKRGKASPVPGARKRKAHSPAPPTEPRKKNKVPDIMSARQPLARPATPPHVPELELEPPLSTSPVRRAKELHVNPQNTPIPVAIIEEPVKPKKSHKRKEPAPSASVAIPKQPEPAVEHTSISAPIPRKRTVVKALTPKPPGVGSIRAAAEAAASVRKLSRHAVPFGLKHPIDIPDRDFVLPYVAAVQVDGIYDDPDEYLLFEKSVEPPPRESSELWSPAPETITSRRSSARRDTPRQISMPPPPPPLNASSGFFSAVTTLDELPQAGPSEPPPKISKFIPNETKVFEPEPSIISTPAPAPKKTRGKAHVSPVPVAPTEARASRLKAAAIAEPTNIAPESIVPPRKRQKTSKGKTKASSPKTPFVSRQVDEQGTTAIAAEPFFALDEPLEESNARGSPHIGLKHKGKADMTLVTYDSSDPSRSPSRGQAVSRDLSRVTPTSPSKTPGTSSFIAEMVHVDDTPLHTSPKAPSPGENKGKRTLRSSARLSTKGGE